MQDAPLSQIVRDRIGPESKLALLRASLERDYSIFVPSVRDSYESNPGSFCSLGEEICSGLAVNFAQLSFDDFCRYYADFTIEQNRLQRAYIRSGNYSCGTHEHANKLVYQQDERMRCYMIAAVITQFFWPHHLSVFQFFLHEFVQKNAEGVETVIEFAPGHGFFGRKALEIWSEASLTGIDISRESVETSRKMGSSTPMASRLNYIVGNALDWRGRKASRVIAGELLEHLDQPQMLMDSIYNSLLPGGCAFVTAAITAAQMDHVWEFKDTKEVFAMATKAGLELKSFIEKAPKVIQKNTDKIPRVLAMVLSRPVTA